MYRFLMLFFVLGILSSCSKNEPIQPPADIIPDNIEGVITEFNVTPLDINTPDKGTFFIIANNTAYQVDFRVTNQAASNAIINFRSDTILIDESREFANMGQDAIAYYPLAPNVVSIFFNDGKKIVGSFDINSSFGGAFGGALISQWRDSAEPTKPTQQAKDDIIHFVHRYADIDGPGPETAPAYIFVTVSKK